MNERLKEQLAAAGLLSQEVGPTAAAKGLNGQREPNLSEAGIDILSMCALSDAASAALAVQGLRTSASTVMPHDISTSARNTEYEAPMSSRIDDGGTSS